MNKRVVILILCLSLASCSSNKLRFIGAAAAIAGGVALASGEGGKKPANSIIKLDQSGTLIELGGAIISETEVLHVTHWPTREGQKIQARTNDGGKFVTFITSKEDLGFDLSILTVDPPFDLSNHNILPIGEAAHGKPVTVERLRRKPFSTIVTGSDSGSIKIQTRRGFIEDGDSGKRWIQIIDGKPHVISLTYLHHGVGPSLFDLTNQK